MSLGSDGIDRLCRYRYDSEGRSAQDHMNSYFDSYYKFAIGEAVGEFASLYNRERQTPDSSARRERRRAICACVLRLCSRAEMEAPSWALEFSQGEPA